MSTYSPSLRIELITNGTQAGTWGDTTNSNLAYILDTAIAGYQTVSVISASQALTYTSGPTSTASANQSVYAMLRFTTTTGAAFAVYAPPASKAYIIWNNSGFSMTIYNSTVIGNTTAAGTGIVVADGKKVMVFSDATNFYTIDAANLTGTVAIANGGTGQTTANAALNALLPSQGGNANKYLQTDGTNSSWDTVSLSTADITGTLAVANGGTGATTASGARTNLGLVIGTDVLAPSGSAANLTNFPTLNQNTTGYAAGIAGGVANKVLYQAGANTTAFIDAPTTASTYLGWTGSAFAWSSVPTPTTFASDITVNGLTVGKGNGAVSTNTAFGVSALANVLSFDSSVSAFGYQAGSSASNGCGGSTFIGASAGRLASGGNNTFVGSGSGFENLGGGSNTAVGYLALGQNQTGSSNVAVGSQAGYASTGSNNTAVGQLTGGFAAYSGSNLTLLGYQATPSTTSVSNQITLGNSSVSVLRCQVTSITALSDARDKYDIEDLPVGLSFINALKARRFKWDRRDAYFDEVTGEDGRTNKVPVPKDGSRKSTEWSEGFVAQEADEAATAAGAGWMNLVYKENPEKLEVTPGKLIPVLVKAIQELTARLEALEARN